MSTNDEGSQRVEPWRLRRPDERPLPALPRHWLVCEPMGEVPPSRPFAALVAKGGLGISGRIYTASRARLLDAVFTSLLSHSRFAVPGVGYGTGRRTSAAGLSSRSPS